MTARASGATSVPVAICAPEHRQAILWAAILASSMGFIDSSVTANALPAMRASLAASLPQAQWFSGIYLLALTSLILVGGALGDRFGTARGFGMGIILFVVSSLGCALAISPETMIVARGLQGVAAALMVPGSMAIIGRAFPREERGAALGLWAAASIATASAGPILAGLCLMVDPVSGWRWIFALNLPLGGISLWLLARFALADQGRPGVPIDYIGAALATLGFGLVAYGLSAETGESLALMAVGFAVLAAFIVWEARCPAPMIRLSMFRVRRFSAINLATFLLYFAVTGIGFYLPMTAVSAWGADALAMVAAFLPGALMIATLSTRMGKLADRLGPARFLVCGAVLVALSQAGLAMTAHEALYWTRAVPLMWLSGFGMALLVAPLTTVVMTSATDADQGAASGINNAVARAASLLAIALMGRMAAAGYGGIGADTPGFGVIAATPAHIAATGVGFSHIAGLAAIASLASALVSAWGLRKPR
ncbi:MFS transporter [Cypionkella sp.]|uniref:MFS transporter n=1 Tax=Cypionkella sp. TaxID=2811411 RepID=UPI0026086AF5|nr:MFS transporter [Cypionkella sp.]MDB5665282.1 transporter [Cypionkella sp.]